MLSQTVENRISVSIAIVTVLFVAAVAWIPPATQYEPSLVSSLPITVWLLFYVSLIGSASLIIYGAIYERPTWKWGTGLVLITYAGFFALPLARQYVVYGGLGFDSWVHFGIIKDVLASGDVSELTYPATHLLSVALVVMTDIRIETTQPVLAYWFKLLLIIGVFTCVRSLSEDHVLSLFTLAAALPILYYSYNRLGLYPWLFGLTILPFIIQYVFDYNRMNDRRMLFPLVFCSAALVMYHPISTVFTVFAVAILLVSYRYVPQFTAKDSVRIYGWIFVISLATGLMAWHLTQPTVEGSIRGTFESIFTGELGAGTRTADQAAETNYTLIQLLTRFIIPVWGVILLYHGLSALGSVAVSYRLVRNRVTKTDWGVVARLIDRIPLTVSIAPGVPFGFFRDRITEYEGTIIIQFVFGVFLGGIFMIVNIHAGGNISRAMQYSLLFAIFGVGLVLWIGFSEVESPTVSSGLTVVLVLLLLVSLAFSTGTAYKDNNHVTEATVSGYEWNLDYKDMNQVTYSDTNRNVISYYILGYTEVKRAGDKVRTEQGLSPHLGYHEESTIREGVSETGYVMIRTEDMSWYQTEPEWRHDDLEYFTENDYQRLVNDQTAHRAYDNGEVRIWKIREPPTDASR